MTPRKEYPRPQFVRSSWINLNGEWDFQFDDKDQGVSEKWFLKPTFERRIVVPYVYQSKLSQINLTDVHDIVWYSKRIYLNEEMLKGRVILHFGAVDYLADIWVNGEHVMTHQGGHVSFSVDITDQAKEENLVVVRVRDYTTDLELPRGKQYWKTTSESIFYTRSTGIWQTVWIEAVPKTYLSRVFLTPDIDKKSLLVEYEVEGSGNVEMSFAVSRDGLKLISERFAVEKADGKKEILLDELNGLDWTKPETVLWSPEAPNLFDITFRLYGEGGLIDEISSYFAMRKVSADNGKFMLNNQPYYQKFLLDQGYWEDSLLTAPADEDFVTDIKMAKAMGFNGVRKHQKVEDPRFHYWADKMGFLVWAEMANAYVYSRKYVNRMISEWTEAIKRDYNHPCIVAWVPINESWGVEKIEEHKEEQAHAASLYYLTKSLDQTRPVMSNDGWQHTQSDLLTIHDYDWSKEILKERYDNIISILDFVPSGRKLYASGWSYDHQPIIASEIAGISYQKSEKEGWGYSNASDDTDFALRYYNIISAFLESPLVQGFVVTQITDIEQEINGLMTYRRKPKIDVDIIRKINEGQWKPS